jgi:hypothetical protein
MHNSLGFIYDPKAFWFAPRVSRLSQERRSCDSPFQFEKGRANLFNVDITTLAFAVKLNPKHAAFPLFACLLPRYPARRGGIRSFRKLPGGALAPATVHLIWLFFVQLTGTENTHDS